MQRNDALLLDMLLAARRIRTFTSGYGWGRFAADEKTQSAVYYQLQIIGRSGGENIRDFREAHLEIPWARIVGLRYRLAHDYLHIELPKIWNIAANYIPPLIDALEPLVPPPPPAEDKNAS